MTLVDTLRVLIAFIEAFVCGASLMIAYRYFRLIHGGYSSPLRWHVCLIALSYVLATCYIVGDIASRIGQPISWKTPLALAVMLIGAPALLAILIHLYNVEQRRK